MPRILMERSGEMEVFARVVQEGGFSAAARSLDLTPSAVSKLIGRLEERLGTRLLVRTTRALALTEEGEVYHRAALRILQEIEEADQAVGGGAVRGRLRVSASIPFGRMYVAPAVASFLEEHPGLRLDFSLTDDVIDLLEQRTDVAIRMGRLPDSNLRARKLGETRRIVCAAPAYLERHGAPRVPRDLEKHECLSFTFRRDRPSWPFRIDGRDVEQPVSGRLLVNNGDSLRQMAIAGVGIARTGQFHVAEHIAAGRLVPLLEDYNAGDIEPIHAVYNAGGPVPYRVRAFIDHLAAWFAATPLAEAARPLRN